MIADQVSTRVDESRAKIIAGMSTKRAEAERSTGPMMLVQPIVLIILFIAYAVFASLFARGISNLLKDVVSRLEQIEEGEGDLTQKIAMHSNDEVGMVAEYYNNFSDKLGAVIRVVQTALRELAVSSLELSSNTEDTAASVNQIAAHVENIKRMSQGQSLGVEESAGEIEDISRGIEQRTEMIERQSVNVINETSNQVQEKTRGMKTRAGSIREQIRELKQLTNEIKSSMDEISQGTNEINSAVNEIRELSWKTKESVVQAAREAEKFKTDIATLSIPAAV
jgi:methyl-accepting chemotaxis protein